MSKSAASQDSSDTGTHMDLFKKFKRFNPLEPSLGIVGFFLVVVLFIFCFFYLDYGAAVRGPRTRGFSLLGLHFAGNLFGDPPLLKTTNTNGLRLFDGRICDHLLLKIQKFTLEHKNSQNVSNLLSWFLIDGVFNKVKHVLLRAHQSVGRPIQSESRVHSSNMIV